jgi:Spy/CpxP family protein refolding chaperone
MKTLKVVSGIALILVVGILFGSFGMQLLMRDRLPPPPPHGAPKAADFVLKRLSRDLSLTDDQKTKVRVLLEQTDEKLQQHFMQAEPEMKKIIDDGLAKIGKELTDEQKVKLDRFKEQLERHRHPGSRRDK